MTNISIIDRVALLDDLRTVISEELDKRKASDLSLKVFTAEEVYAQLRISRCTFWKWMKAGYITPLPRGGSKGKLLFKAGDVEAIVKSNPKWRRGA